jgi:hypothetical protein
VNALSRVTNVNVLAQGPILPIVCPACRREGNFGTLGQDVMFNLPTIPPRPNMVRQVGVGHRLCPNPQCATHVFVIYEGGRMVRTFPAGRIDFDSAGVPERVVKAFDEALSCTANECYTAAAMLIRKTLEAVCDDLAAKGADLKHRILDLQSKVTLPKELFEAMDHLRLLGNDAAHVESREYDTIGPEEVGAGIELTKEIIKSTYQYKSLLGRLIALKKPAGGSQSP